MSNGIVFFVDVNIKKGGMPFNEIEKKISTEVLEVEYAFEDKDLSGIGDEKLIKRFNSHLKEINSGKNRFEGFFITHDTHLDWNSLKRELGSNFHLIEIEFSDEAEFQYQQQAQKNFWEEKSFNPKEIPLVIDEIKNQVISRCNSVLNSNSS